MAFEVKHDSVMSADGMKYRVSVTADMQDLTSREMIHRIVHLIADRVAEQYVAEHYQEIVSKIDQQAIATLSVAESGAKIREALEKDIVGRTERIVETKREVYQRGIFGGTKRIL